MCGIVTAIATNNIVPALLEGLRKLEYRGYDSAGLAVLSGELTRLRSAGRVAELAALADARRTGVYAAGRFALCAEVFRNNLQTGARTALHRRSSVLTAEIRIFAV